MAPVLEKWSLALVVCLIAIASMRIVATYSKLSITSDEPAHFACGLEYLSKHVYRLETQHPPLSRAMVALGPYLEGLRPAGLTEFWHEGFTVLNRYGNVDHTVFLMRLGILPFFVLGSVVVYLWGSRHFGKAAAVLATVMFTLEPTVLAHGGMATTDMALAACLGAAFFTLLLWVEAPTWGHGVLLGIATAAALLSKFTTLGYLPVSASLALLIYAVTRRLSWRELVVLAKKRLPTFGVAAGTAALLIWAAYFFSFGKVPAWGVSLPAPEFFDGITVAMKHNSTGHASYLLGEYGMKGWWYYFPVALTVKTPLAMLLLLPAGVYACWRRRKGFGAAPVAFCLGVLLPAMTSHVNIGTRHVLPVFMGFSLIAALGIVQLTRWIRIPVLNLGIPALLIVWVAFSGARQDPEYLAYFNEIAGDEPESVLVDSDLDWGQDLKFLSKRLHEVGAKQVSVMLPWEPGDIAYLAKFYGLPPVQPIQPTLPTEGWNVVSSTLLHVTPGGGKHHPTRPEYQGLLYSFNGPWYERVWSTEKVGALLLYKIPHNFAP